MNLLETVPTSATVTKQLNVNNRECIYPVRDGCVQQRIIYSIKKSISINNRVFKPQNSEEVHLLTLFNQRGGDFNKLFVFLQN